MRPVVWADVVAAAAWMARMAPQSRAGALDAALAAARVADAHRKRLRRRHPRWGDGSLAAAVAALGGGCARVEPVLDDPALCSAAAQVLGRLAARAAAHRARRGAAGGWQAGGLCLYAGHIATEGALPMQDRRTRKVSALDPVWQRIRDEAEAALREEPLLGSALHASLLHHATLEDALAYRFALKLSSAELGEQVLREIAAAAYAAEPALGRAARADLAAVFDRDPACTRLAEAILFFKGFQAIQAHRVAHWLWAEGRRDMALFVQARASEVFSVDIHPAARIGQGIMVDHAHGIVIGETAVVGNDVSMLHSVTLGGTGKEDGDRHPKIGDGVLIGAGAKVLGNIRVGRCVRIAAGSVVLEDVPPMVTVAGVPARVVGSAGCDTPAATMDHRLRGEG